MRRSTEEQLEQFMTIFMKFVNNMEETNRFSGAVAQTQIAQTMEQMGDRLKNIENTACTTQVLSERIGTLTTTIGTLTGTIKGIQKNSVTVKDFKFWRNAFIVAVGTIFGGVCVVAWFLIQIALFP
jgi:hypothetical protein